MAKLDIYQTVTDRILEALDNGTVPWRQPIKRSPGSGGDGLPKSLNTKKPYRGINIFLLAMTSWAMGYESDYWLTYRQAKQQGGQVRKGEKSSLVVFWKRYTKEDPETGKDKIIPVIRHYNVFNVEQCEGIDAPNAAPRPPESESEEDTEPFEPIGEAEHIFNGYATGSSRETSEGGGPEIQHGGRQACYLPSADRVRIAEPVHFESVEGYYATLFHELVHSTGHSSRLDRGLDTKLAPFGSADYSKEELVAEMGAAFLAAHAGISPQTIEQSAAYIDNWRKRLRGDNKLVVQAAGVAQRASDLILGITFDDATDKEVKPELPGSGAVSQLHAPPTTPTGQSDQLEKRKAHL